MPRTYGQFELEAMIEAHGFAAVLEMLERICGERASLTEDIEWARRATQLRTMIEAER